MPVNTNANLDRDALLRALTSAETKAMFSDQQIHQMIEAEMSKPAELIDGALLDACFRLSERRHSPFTNRELERSERRGLKQLRQTMRDHEGRMPSRRPLLVKLAVCAALSLAVFLLPMFNSGLPFRIDTSLDEEQYLVVGISQSDIGIVRAAGNRSPNSGVLRLTSLEEIPPLLGYRVELPHWIPEGCELVEIHIVRSAKFDEILILYAGEERSIAIEISYFDERAGIGTSYEQNQTGQKTMLQNGTTIYSAYNEQSEWGLFQSPNLDYFIETVGFEEKVVINMFESIGG